MSNCNELRGFKLVVTSECNFRCSYCCQNDKKPGAMTWSIARDAIDRLMRSKEPEIEIGFWGGEPLLEFPLIRRSVEYTLARADAGRKVRFAISTNGALLSDEIISFLAEHHFRTQISFDGVESAQAARKKGSFRTLHDRLTTIRAKEPAYFVNDLTLSMTVTPENMNDLPRSVEYFLGEDVRSLSMAPLFTPLPWDRTVDLDHMREIFREVLHMSVRHYERTGHIPVTLLRKEEKREPEIGSSLTMCGIRGGTRPSVDIDGEVYGCVALVRSVQTARSDRFDGMLDSLGLGRLDGSGFDEKAASFSNRIDRQVEFMKKEEKFSSFGRCGDCEYLDECSVCPVSIANDPDNDDPRRVPDFYCAFNKAALAARRLLPESLDAARMVRGGGGVKLEMERFMARAGGEKPVSGAGTFREARQSPSKR